VPISGAERYPADAERARRTWVRYGNSHRQADQGERRERRKGRRVRRDQAVAELPGDGLVEREGRRGWHCQEVEKVGVLEHPSSAAAS
jgi:hypothetical protein